MNWSNIRNRLGSVLVAAVGALMAMKGAGDLDWAGLADRFTGEGGPMIFFGLLLIVYRAWQGKEQMEIKAPKRLGKKP
jgi:hypothetical protein